MQKISTILSVIALALIGVLFFLFFNHNDQLKKITVATQHKSATDFKIAYFEMDSLEAHYDYFKDALAQANTKQEAMNMELSAIEKNDKRKITEWQQKGSTMSQTESEQARQEYETMQSNFQNRKEALQQELMKHNENLKADIKNRIETYLKEFNKLHNYSFIFAYDPNISFMYYKDTVYNVTPDIIVGLNESYKKKN